HGEAVAYGMLAALALGTTRGVTPTDARSRLTALITKLGPLPPVADLSAKDVVSAIARDKKIIAGTLHFVAATAIGGTRELNDVTETQLRHALTAIGITQP
ncbi:MAG: 3-dehydroquinate synthase, partial [Acidobacteria bacterium]|nr:3-dehydroquinate synthase [Acidobacteriota bacterium]